MIRLTSPPPHERPSQLADQGTGTLADKLTESLRINGDLGLAAPNFSGYVYRSIFERIIEASSRSNDVEEDADGDQIILTGTYNSQFTQQLMLFVGAFRNSSRITSECS